MPEPRIIGKKGSILLFPIEDDATIRNGFCYEHTLETMNWGSN